MKPGPPKKSVSHETSDHGTTSPSFDENLSSQSAEILSLRHEILRLTQEADFNRSLSAAVNSIEDKFLEDLSRETKELDAKLKAARDRVALVTRELDTLRADLNAVHRSTSWRITRPLRAIGSRLKRGRST